MDFKYTSYIYIESSDLEEMVLRVKQGEEFSEVFYDIMSGYDDDDYYNCGLIIDEVEKEVNRRLK